MGRTPGRNGRAGPSPRREDRRVTTTAPLPTTSTASMRYAGLIVMMLPSFLLVTAEFLASGALAEMAPSFGVTPGPAGQTVKSPLSPDFCSR